MATPTLFSRIRSAVNAFRLAEENPYGYYEETGRGYSLPRHKVRMSTANEQSIINPALNRCAIDISMIGMKHVRVDENDTFESIIDSGLNNCLTLEANIDQSAFAFMMDVVISMFDEGAVAIIPVDTSIDIRNPGSFDILTLRTGKILEWFPRHVRVRAYNDNLGDTQDIILPKARIAIVENPLYYVMNETNSTLKRLVNKLNLLDSIDTQSGSGKLDLLLQFPFAIKSEAKQAQADKRLAALESQLQDSKHGIAYVDATEKVIPLNRPVENNLMGQIEFLTRMLYGQLGLSQEIFEGTADESQWLNYFKRTINPCLRATGIELKRKFLTKTARSQGQSIKSFRSPFDMITAADLAEMSDKLSRNEILTGNEIRGVIGFQPSKDPSANELRNKNINTPDSKQQEAPVQTVATK